MRDEARVKRGTRCGRRCVEFATPPAIAHSDPDARRKAPAVHSLQVGATHRDHAGRASPCSPCGIAMIVLPGPAILVIPVGLGILGLEFAWARHLAGQDQGAQRRAGRSRSSAAAQAGRRIHDARRAFPVEFILFAAMLAGVAIFHRHALTVALLGPGRGGRSIELTLGGFLEGSRSARARRALRARMGRAGPICSRCCWALRCLRDISSSLRFPRCCRASCPMTGRAASRCSRWCSCCPAFSTTLPQPSSAARWRQRFSVSACTSDFLRRSSRLPMPAARAA